MEGYTFCQSCGMPIDQMQLMGIERDGSRSTIYCSYCYQDGEFTHPEMTMEEMKEHVRIELYKNHAAESVISKAVARVPHLSRWLGIPAIHHNREWH